MGVINFIQKFYESTKSQNRLIICVLLVSCFNFLVAQTLFSHQALSLVEMVGEWWDSTFGLDSSFDGENKLRKMTSLWSPYKHPFLYAAHSAFVVSALYIIRKQSETSGAESAFDRVWRCAVFGVCCCLWTLLPVRIGETHFSVIALNLIHVWAVTFFAEFSNSLLSKSEIILSKFYSENWRANNLLICFITKWE